MSQTTFYVERGFTLDSKVPPSPPPKPTNKPIHLGTRTDEEIILFTKYEFTLSVQVLLANSRKNRRPRRNSGPPRPQNPFILYRRDKVKKYENEFAGLKSSVVSQKVAEMWNNETLEVKHLFEALARLSEKVHMQEYRDYKYKPRKKSRNDKERYSPIPDSPALDNRDNSSNYSPISSSSSDNEPISNDDDILFDFITFGGQNESYNTASNFSTLGDIAVKEPSGVASNNHINISGTYDGIKPIDTSCEIALSELYSNPPLCFDALGNMVPIEFNTTFLDNTINSNDTSLSFGDLHPVGPINLQVAPPVQFDEKFITFAYNLYNFISANPNPPMRPGADNTAFLGSAFDEPNHIGNY